MAKYKFTNQLIFAMVMRDEEICKIFIERLFNGRTVRKIHFSNVESEKSIIMGIKSKSVRLDVMFEGDNTLYDLEMQIEPDYDIAKRTRYYHAAMNRYDLRKGDEYGNLRSSYVIFICLYDPFGLGEGIYNFQMTDERLGLQLGDGGYTIILNARCPKEKIPKGLETFFEYVGTGAVDKMDKFICKIDENVEKANNDEEVESVMTLEEEMKIQSRRAEKRGIERGAADKQREIAKNFKNSGISPDIIAENTGLTLEEVEAL